MQVSPLFSSLHITRLSAKTLQIEFKADDSQEIFLQGKMVGQGEFLEKGAFNVIKFAKEDHPRVVSEESNKNFPLSALTRGDLIQVALEQLLSWNYFETPKKLLFFFFSILKGTVDNSTITSSDSETEKGNVILELNREPSK